MAFFLAAQTFEEKSFKIYHKPIFNLNYFDFRSLSKPVWIALKCKQVKKTYKGYGA